jgi:hypothetical protein
MKALIAPNESPIKHITSWNTEYTPAYPIYSDIPNSCRVAQVEPDEQTFPVAEPLFWTDCADDVVADKWYYDTVALTINKIVNAPKPAA